MNVSPKNGSPLSRFARLNLWLASRVWIAICALVAGVVLLGVGVVMLAGRVGEVTERSNDNTKQLIELRYRSCIEDAVLQFKIAEGDVVAAAFAVDRVQLGEKLPAYQAALEDLRGAQKTCRARFPE